MKQMFENKKEASDWMQAACYQFCFNAIGFRISIASFNYHMISQINIENKMKNWPKYIEKQKMMKKRRRRQINWYKIGF